MGQYPLFLEVMLENTKLFLFILLRQKNVMDVKLLWSFYERNEEKLKMNKSLSNLTHGEL